MVTKTFTYEGRRYYIRAKTEQEALIKMANKIRDLEEGKVVLSGNMTVSEWANKAVATYKTGMKENTLKNYNYDIQHYILDYIGNRQLKSVKPVECQEVLNRWAGKSKDVLKRTYRMLKFIFTTAVQNKLIIDNPAENLIIPAGTKTTRRAITEQERLHLFKVADKDQRYVLFLLMLQCGCRPSEASECKGMDIQEIDGEIVLHIRGTKTEKSDRYVPIPPDLYHRIKNTNPFEYIAHTKTGHKFTESNYRNLVKSLYRAMNISMGCRMYRNQLVPPYPLAEDFVPYCLRHTYCTDLRDMGIDIRTAQYLMGHADINMTANVYTHMNNNTLVDASKRIKSATVGATPNTTLQHQTVQKNVR